jgi:hypothetical protein
MAIGRKHSKFKKRMGIFTKMKLKEQRRQKIPFASFLYTILKKIQPTAFRFSVLNGFLTREFVNLHSLK